MPQARCQSKKDMVFLKAGDGNLTLTAIFNGEDGIVGPSCIWGGKGAAST